MKILIAPDKFKGSLDALQVSKAIADGILKFDDSIEITIQPLADGGDGTIDILNAVLDLERVYIDSVNALGKPIRTYYYKKGQSAYIELASASGIAILETENLDILHSNTYGTGLIIKDAIQKGANEIHLFLGGSATNDAGIGIANALGINFYDVNNQSIDPIAKNLSSINKIDNSEFISKYNHVSIKSYVDVRNPFSGKNGAAYIFSAQKGALGDDILFLEHGLKHLEKVIQSELGFDISNLVGGGAAGGVSGGLYGMLNASIESGFAFISESIQLSKQVQDADIIISGEGKFDNQSLDGKVISGLMKYTKSFSKPLILFVGINDLGSHPDIQFIDAIVDYAENLSDAHENGIGYLKGMAFEFMRKYEIQIKISQSYQVSLVLAAFAILKY